MSINKIYFMASSRFFKVGNNSINNTATWINRKAKPMVSRWKEIIKELMKWRLKKKESVKQKGDSLKR
jgi:hypothetical protein